MPTVPQPEKTTRSQLVQGLSANFPQVPEETCDDIVRWVFEEIVRDVCQGRRVTIHNFGRFDPVVKASRQAYNSRDKGMFDVPRRRGMKFVVAPAFNQAIQEAEPEAIRA